MRSFLPIALLATLLAWSPTSAQAGVCAKDADLNSCLSSSDAISACSNILQRNQSDTSARLSLCEAYVAKKDLDKARTVITQGIELCGRRRCAALKFADSNILEMQQSANRTATVSTSSRDRTYCTGPIANSRSIDACKNVLRTSPQDQPILETLANKLLKNNKPTEALSYLQRSNSLTASGRALLAKAKQEHKTAVGNCLQGNSLSNCNTVLLAGDTDEHNVQRRRGQLLAASGNPQDALNALLTSRQLKPNDQDTARAIAALDRSNYALNDPKLLRAMADAERVLGNEVAELALLQDLVAADPQDKAALARIAALNPAPKPVREPAPKPVKKEIAIAKTEPVIADPVVVEKPKIVDKPVVAKEVAPPKATVIAASPGDRSSLITPVDENPPPIIASTQDSRTAADSDKFVNLLDELGRSH